MMEYCKCRGDEMDYDVPDDDVNAYGAALKRIAELEAALQFYADPANHEKATRDSQGFSLVDLDEGERARLALEGGAS